jgi:hypothetical protein
MVGFFVSTADAGRVRLDQAAKPTPQQYAQARMDEGRILIGPSSFRGETPVANYTNCPGVDCQDTNQNAYVTADVGLGYKLADDQMGEAGDLTDFCFWGIYYRYNAGWSACPTIPTSAQDNFRLQVLGDAGGYPDSNNIIASFSDLQCTRTQDDLISWIGAYEYIYTCDLPSSVTVDLCEVVWLEITNDLTPTFPPNPVYPDCSFLMAASDTSWAGPGMQTTYDIPWTSGDASGYSHAWCMNLERYTTAECTEPCDTAHTIDINIVTDAWGYETSWELFDLTTGAVVCSGSGYPNYGDVWEQCCVDGTCYEFCIYDSFGDGIYSPGGYAVYFDGEEWCSTIGVGWYGSVDCSCTDIGGCVDPNAGACCLDNYGPPVNCVYPYMEADCLAIEGNTTFAGAGTSCNDAGCTYTPCGSGSFN